MILRSFGSLFNCTKREINNKQMSTMLGHMTSDSARGTGGEAGDSRGSSYSRQFPILKGFFVPFTAGSFQ